MARRRRTASTGKRAGALFAVTTAVAATCGALVASELIVRTFLLTPYVPATAADMNRRMARQPPWGDAKPPPACRIIGVADSFGTTLGLENYHYLLERNLRTPAAPWRVFNLSVPALSPLDELQIIQRFALGEQARILLHGIFVGNDFDVSSAESKYRVGRAEVTIDGQFSRFLPNRWAIAQWIRGEMAVARETRKRRAERGDGIDGLSRETFLELETQSLAQFQADAEVPNARQVAALLDASAIGVRRISAAYVIVIHPDRLQIEDDLFAAIKARAPGVAVDRDRPQALLMNYCRDRQVACLDLLPVFRLHASEGPLYLPFDTHYNERGQALAAKTIAAFLKSEDLTGDCEARANAMNGSAGDK